jgi:hypothetical protein
MAAAGHRDGYYRDITPGVQQQKLWNPLSDRRILKGGAKYKELFSKGYTPDPTNTVLLPPNGNGNAAA